MVWYGMMGLKTLMKEDDGTVGADEVECELYLIDDVVPLSRHPRISRRRKEGGLALRHLPSSKRGPRHHIPGNLQPPSSSHSSSSTSCSIKKPFTHHIPS